MLSFVAQSPSVLAGGSRAEITDAFASTYYSSPGFLARTAHTHVSPNTTTHAQQDSQLPPGVSKRLELPLLSLTRVNATAQKPRPMMTRKRSLLLLPLLLLLHACHVATAAAAAAASVATITSTSSARSPPPELPVFLLLKRTRGGAAGRGIAGGGGGSSSGFPSLPFFTTTTQPPKSSSSSSHSSSSSTAAAPTSWGSEHFDARPLVLEPRVVENIKSRDSRVGLIRKVTREKRKKLCIVCIL